MAGEDFFRYRRYRLELDGVAHGAFEEVEAPGVAVPVELGPDQLTRPGPASRTHAKLRHGVANTRELFSWFSKVLAGTPEGRHVTLVERDESGRLVARHVFEDAWPVRIRLATLSEDQLFDVEEIELAVARWTREDAAGDE